MANELKNAVARFSRMITEAEESAKQHLDFQDMTSTQLNYLESVAELDNPSITELAQALKLSKPTVTVTVNRLIEKGLVYKTRSDADRRSAHIHLTDIGRQINLRHDIAHNSLCQTIAKHLSPTEQQQLTELLTAITETE